MEIRMEKCKELKQKPDQKHLGFGKYMTDYMFVMDWTMEGCKNCTICTDHFRTGMCNTSLCTGNF